MKKMKLLGMMCGVVILCLLGCGKEYDKNQSATSKNQNTTSEMKEDDWYPDKVSLKVTKIISQHQFIGEATEDSMKEALQKGETFRVNYDQYQEYRYHEAEKRNRVIQGKKPEVGKTFTVSFDGVEDSQGEKRIDVHDIQIYEEERDGNGKLSNRVTVKLMKVISSHEILVKAMEDSEKESLKKGDTVKVDYAQYREYRYDEASSRYKVLSGKKPEVGKLFTISFDGVEVSQGEKKIGVNDIDVFEEENV